MVNTSDDKVNLAIRNYAAWEVPCCRTTGTRQRPDRVRIPPEIADDTENLTQPDHPLFANWSPTGSKVSARKYNHRYADHDGEKIGWVRGYYAGTAGHVSSETVKNYIQRHEEDES